MYNAQSTPPLKTEKVSTILSPLFHRTLNSHYHRLVVASKKSLCWYRSEVGRVIGAHRRAVTHPPRYSFFAKSLACKFLVILGNLTTNPSMPSLILI